MIRVVTLIIVVVLAEWTVALAGPDGATQDYPKPVGELVQAIRQGDLPAIRDAWKRATECGSAAVVPLLRLSSGFTRVSELNWITTATHRAVDRALSQQEVLDETSILQLLGDQSQPSAIRRLALEVMDKSKPGFRQNFLKKVVDDREFLRDQIAEQIQDALRMRDAQQTEESQRLLIDAYRRAADAEQIAAAFRHLNDPAIQPALHVRLGIVSKWHLMGPFPAEKEKGPTTRFPVDEWNSVGPFDLLTHAEAKFADKSYQWIPVQMPGESTSLKFNLAFPGMNDSVAFAYARLESNAERAVQILASGGETIELWLNGSKVIDAPFYNQRPRMDRHRAQAKLIQGTNAILVKVCTGEGAGEGGGRGGSPTGELFLRITDVAGQSIEVKQP